MTHTLHRQGSVESLEKDYVVFAMPSSGLNHQGSLEKLLKVYEIFMQYNPINIGDSKSGSRYSLGSADAVREVIQENELVHAVFNSRQTVLEVLKELKKEDLGLSIVVSGLNDEVCQCVKDAGLDPHTVAQSLGIWGRTDLLPKPKILEIATMCGHGLVSYQLISELADQVAKGKITAEEAGRQLAKPCICGVYNPERAASLIRELTDL
ncbi:MAG: hypothetical protein P4N59_19875 [Negativicutes bacterium]|nr:hypothetical protein [Negativicutes bacterium]